MQAKQLGLEGVPQASQGLSLDFLIRMTELTDRRIQQLVEQGILKRIDRGQYALTSVRDYIRYLRGIAEGKGYSEGGEGGDAKERKLLAEAEFWELRVQERKQELHRQRDIERLLQGAFITFKKQLQALPNIKAPQWHLAPDPQTLRDMVNKDFERLLNELVETALSLQKTTDEGIDEDDELAPEPNEHSDAYHDAMEEALRRFKTDEDAEA